MSDPAGSTTVLRIRIRGPRQIQHSTLLSRTSSPDRPDQAPKPRCGAPQTRARLTSDPLARSHEPKYPFARTAWRPRPSSCFPDPAVSTFRAVSPLPRRAMAVPPRGRQFDADCSLRGRAAEEGTAQKCTVASISDDHGRQKKNQLGAWPVHYRHAIHFLPRP